MNRGGRRKNKLFQYKVMVLGGMSSRSRNFQETRESKD